MDVLVEMCDGVMFYVDIYCLVDVGEYLVLFIRLFYSKLYGFYFICFNILVE